MNTKAELQQIRDTLVWVSESLLAKDQNEALQKTLATLHSWLSALLQKERNSALQNELVEVIDLMSRLEGAYTAATQHNVGYRKVLSKAVQWSSDALRHLDAAITLASSP